MKVARRKLRYIHSATSYEIRLIASQCGFRLRSGAARAGDTKSGSDLPDFVSLDDLKISPGNRLHPLLNDRAGQHAIWINDQWRICFRWTSQGPEAVEIVDYH